MAGRSKLSVNWFSKRSSVTIVTMLCRDWKRTVCVQVVRCMQSTRQHKCIRCICGALIRRLPCQARNDNWTGAAGKGSKGRVLRHGSCIHVTLVSHMFLSRRFASHADKCRPYYLHSFSFSPLVTVKLNPFSEYITDWIQATLAL